MNTVREIQRINEQELQRGIAGTRASWHAKYAASAWVFVGNLDHALTEGDVLCVLSQYGELEDVHLVREEDTGKSRGFCFGKYEDARSCVLAVDNLCGIELCGRTIRVDHVENYRLPKNLQEQEEQSATVVDPTKAGQAYEGQEMANQYSLDKGQDLFAPPPQNDSDDDSDDRKRAKQKRKQERQLKRDEKERRRREKEKRRSEKEEKKREKRARKMHRAERKDNINDDRPRSKKRRHDSEDDDSSRSVR